MTSAHYTEARDPDAERAVAEVVAAIVERARRIDGLDALVLGGSLGRSEGTVTVGPDGPTLASDVEVYLVGRDSSLRSAASDLQEHFAGSGPEVSAAWLHPEMLRTGRAKNLSRRPSRTIRLYELSPDVARTLVGTPPPIHPIDPATLPLAEGVRLILNRLAEGSVALAIEAPEAGRWIDKILMACGDTLLLAAGGYTARYRDRADRLAGLAEPWPMPPGWRAEVTSAYERKLSGTARGGEAEAARPDEIVLATLGPAAQRVAGVTLEPLATFPRRFVVAGARRHELLRYLPPVGPAAQYEAAILLARGWRARRRPTARALRQAVLGRPLSLALQASALPLYLGVVRRDEALIRAAAESLAWAGIPRRQLARAGTPAALAELLRRHWQSAT